jgi:hypothetical protein
MQVAKHSRFSRNRRRWSRVSSRRRSWTLSIHRKQKSAYGGMLGIVSMAEKARARSAGSGT